MQCDVKARRGRRQRETAALYVGATETAGAEGGAHASCATSALMEWRSRLSRSALRALRARSSRRSNHVRVRTGAGIDASLQDSYVLSLMTASASTLGRLSRADARDASRQLELARCFCIFGFSGFSFVLPSPLARLENGRAHDMRRPRSRSFSAGTDVDGVQGAGVVGLDGSGAASLAGDSLGLGVSGGRGSTFAAGRHKLAIGPAAGADTRRCCNRDRGGRLSGRDARGLGAMRGAARSGAGAMKLFALEDIESGVSGMSSANVVAADWDLELNKATKGARVRDVDRDRSREGLAGGAVDGRSEVTDLRFAKGAVNVVLNSENLRYGRAGEHGVTVANSSEAAGVRGSSSNEIELGAVENTDEASEDDSTTRRVAEVAEGGWLVASSTVAIFGESERVFLRCLCERVAGGGGDRFGRSGVKMLCKAECGQCPACASLDAESTDDESPEEGDDERADEGKGIHG